LYMQFCETLIILLYMLLLKKDPANVRLAVN